LLELVQEWERRKLKADNEGKGLGKLNVILMDVLRAVNQADSNAKRFGKPVCYYLERGLKTRAGEPGGLGTWSYSMWE
jgi:hypothetical protein